MIPLVAALVLAAATVGLALRVEPIPTWYYHLAWWSYIVGLDDLNRRRTGRSLVRDRPGRFAWLCGVSILWWLLFELVNLRLGNWYYVMNQPSPVVRFLGGMVAFATVLPGIVVTLTFVEDRGWLRRVPVRPLAWSARKERAVLALGLASVALPLAWPDVFYPLVWGSLVFLVEPWNRRHARKSYLRDLEAGEAGPFCQALLAGAICGALWEAWNFWARMKWIYTVPGFEGAKFFEMPVAGLLGFPPFAVESIVALRALSALADRLTAPARRRARIAFAALGPLAAAGVFLVVDPVTVDSIHDPRAETGPPERVRLVRLKGLGDDRVRQLERLGIRTVSDLARQDPGALAATLRANGAAAPRDRFLERRARLWVRAARREEGL